MHPKTQQTRKTFFISFLQTTRRNHEKWYRNEVNHGIIRLHSKNHTDTGQQSILYEIVFETFLKHSHRSEYQTRKSQWFTKRKSILCLDALVLVSVELYCGMHVLIHYLSSLLQIVYNLWFKLEINFCVLLRRWLTVYEFYPISYLFCNKNNKTFNKIQINLFSMAIG